MNADLNDNCVPNTGASGGIGLAAAERFAEQGAELIRHYHTQAEPIC